MVTSKVHFINSKFTQRFVGFVFFFFSEKQMVIVSLTFICLFGSIQVFSSWACREMHSSKFTSSRNSFSSGIKNKRPPSQILFSVLFICASK